MTSATPFRAISDAELGLLLADSDVVELSQDACVEYLVAHGVLAPTTVGFTSINHVLVEAHNIRHGREIARKAGRAAAALLSHSLLGGALLFGLASSAMAAEQGTSWESSLGFILVAMVVLGIIVLSVDAVRASRDYHRDRKDLDL